MIHFFQANVSPMLSLEALVDTCMSVCVCVCVCLLIDAQVPKSSGNLYCSYNHISLLHVLYILK